MLGAVWPRNTALFSSEKGTKLFEQGRRHRGFVCYIPLTTMAQAKMIGLEEGWHDEIKTRAIDVLEEILNEGVNKTTKTFSPATFMPIYTTCYNMCTQRSPYNWSEQLYQRHGRKKSPPQLGF